MHPHRSILLLIAPLLLAALPVAAVPLIDVGTHYVQPNSAAETIQLSVQGGDLVDGLELMLQIGGGHAGPTLQAVDILGGTIFAGNNDGLFPGSYVDTWDAYVGTNTAADPVPASGLIATITVRTVGLSAGMYSLSLTSAFEGATNFAGTPATLIDGVIIISSEVPGPAPRVWDGGGDGLDWYDPRNWSPDGGPEPEDDLTVSAGAPTTEAAVIIDGGSLTLSSASATATLGPLTVTDSGSLTINGGTWVMSGSGQTSILAPSADFALTGGGSVDLRGNRLVMRDSGDGNALAAQMIGWIETGSVGSSDVTLGKAVGFRRDAMAHEVIAAFTWLGDADCDFDVDLDDLTLLGTFYGQSQGARWDLGDFNGDGRVDLDDLTLLGTFYGRTSAGPHSIPEPAVSGLLLLGAAGLLRVRGSSARARRVS